MPGVRWLDVLAAFAGGLVAGLLLAQLAAGDRLSPLITTTPEG